MEAEVLVLYLFTFTFGEDSMLSSAEAIIKFGPMRNPEITERLYESLWGFCKPQKSAWLNLLKFCNVH